MEITTKLRKIALALLMILGITSLQICAAQDDAHPSDIVPRTLEVLDIGYNLPIEIVAVRNLQKREHWVRDLEIEIKNISSKPIYHIFFTLYLPDDKGPSGAFGAFHLEYGRPELLHPREHASTEDKPIDPGASALLKVKEGIWKGYEHHLRVDNIAEEATYNVRMTVLGINFGDGTGFTHGGMPYPRKPWMESRPQRYIRIPLGL